MYPVLDALDFPPNLMMSSRSVLMMIFIDKDQH